MYAEQQIEKTNIRRIPKNVKGREDPKHGGNEFRGRTKTNSAVHRFEDAEEGGQCLLNIKCGSP
jgi:hypothetical protein